jgi:hypothetical protein
VTETEARFDESRLGSTPAADLLCDSVRALAKQWRTAG